MAASVFFENRLEEENSFLEEVKHPNVLKSLGVFSEGNSKYLRLEFIPNGNLQEFVKASGKMSEKAAKTIFIQAVKAVGHCHRCKILHRDVKPENLLITEELDIVLCDFGLAQMVETGSPSLASREGTKSYLAPELLTHKNCYLGFAQDLFSLGVVLYFLVTAKVPFELPHIGDKVYKQIICGNFLPIWEGVGHLSQNCKKLIQGLLLFKASKRMKLEEVLKNEWMEMKEGEEVEGKKEIREALERIKKEKRSDF